MKFDTSENASRQYAQTLEFEANSESFQLEVPEGVWAPTPHGKFLASCLSQLDFTGEHVLELGCGCGIHTILLSRLGAAQVTGTEVSDEVLENCRHNLKLNDCKVTFIGVVADWTHVPGGPFDSLVANPPFCKSGKTYRRYFIDTLILDAHKLLKPGGRLVFVQSSMADIGYSKNLMVKCGLTFRELGRFQGPFRDYYYEDKKFMQEIEEVEGAYKIIDGKHHETLVAFEARL